ncbi:MAG: hypothetical protein ACLTMP_13900 [Eggerthella lenta]
MYVTREVKATVGFGAGVARSRRRCGRWACSTRTRCASPCALEGEDVEQIVAVLKRADSWMPTPTIRQAHWDACPVSPGAPACK